MWVKPGQREKIFYFGKDLDHILNTKKNPEFLETCPGGGLHPTSVFY